MQKRRDITDEMLEMMTPRRRAVLKLRLGYLPLSDEEMATVVQEMREEANVVKPRSLRKVAVYFGVSQERIRQIENRVYEMLGLEAASTAEA